MRAGSGIGVAVMLALCGGMAAAQGLTGGSGATGAGIGVVAASAEPAPADDPGAAPAPTDDAPVGIGLSAAADDAATPGAAGDLPRLSSSVSTTPDGDATPVGDPASGERPAAGTSVAVPDNLIAAATVGVGDSAAPAATSLNYFDVTNPGGGPLIDGSAQ